MQHRVVSTCLTFIGSTSYLVAVALPGYLQSQNMGLPWDLWMPQKLLNHSTKAPKEFHCWHPQHCERRELQQILHFVIMSERFYCCDCSTCLRTWRLTVFLSSLLELCNCNVQINRILQASKHSLQSNARANILTSLLPWLEITLMRKTRNLQGSCQYLPLI